jgi:hypothetical protein
MEDIGLAQVLREIYDNELSFSINAPVWDAGLIVKIGDHENATKAERNFRRDEFDLIPRWLAEQVCLHYPDSDFARRWPTSRLSSLARSAVSD